MLGNMQIRTKVRIIDLVTCLKENKANHEDEYKLAVEEYYRQLQARLSELLASAQSKMDVNYVFNMTKPVLRSKDYDKFISQLVSAMDAGQTELELSTSEYNCFVNDEWDWAVAAKSINSTYASARR